MGGIGMCHSFWWVLKKIPSIAFHINLVVSSVCNENIEGSLELSKFVIFREKELFQAWMQARSNKTPQQAPYMNRPWYRCGSWIGPHLQWKRSWMNLLWRVLGYEQQVCPCWTLAVLDDLLFLAACSDWQEALLLYMAALVACWLLLLLCCCHFSLDKDKSFAVMASFLRKSWSS